MTDRVVITKRSVQRGSLETVLGWVFFAGAMLNVLVILMAPLVGEWEKVWDATPHLVADLFLWAFFTGRLVWVSRSRR